MEENPSLTDENMSIEQAFSLLEAILADMESGGKNLEESFAAYQQGLKLIRYCSGKIEHIEQKLKVLTEGEEA